MSTTVVTEVSENVTVIEVVETALCDPEVIARVAGELSEQLDAMSGRDVVVDFEPVRYLSSHLLGKLLEFRSALQDRGATMIVCGMRPELERILNATNLARIFHLEPTRKDALESLDAPDAH